MKNHIKIFALIILILSFSSLISFAQPSERQITKDIQEKYLKTVEEYADSIDKFVENEKKPNLVFADFSDYNENPKPLWKKFNSEAEFEKYREKTESYTTAYVWQKNKKTVAVNFTYSTPSGDWAYFVVNTYRADGTLAKVDSRLNTFYGSVSVLRAFYFDAKGKKIKETIKYQDLQTDEPFDPKTRDFLDQEVEIYKTVNALPFANLLKTPVKKRNPKVKRRNFNHR